ncbi:Peptidase M13 [Mactra antiquata]
MAILKTFLCICNTRTGSLISGCYTLAISLLCLVYFLFRYVGHKLVEDSAEYKGIIYVGFVLYGFMIVSSLIIIPGVQLDKRYLLLPWIYIVILVVLYDTGSVALLTTVHMEREKTLHIWEIVWLFFYLFRLAANCYCFTCVVSQYQELSDGRGTYDFLYKPQRRARLRNGGQFDIDTFDLPFGVHLPPYTEEDTTEHNPPLYSQIFPQMEANQSDNTTGPGTETSTSACQSFTQGYSNEINNQRCLCQTCLQNYSIRTSNSLQSTLQNSLQNSLRRTVNNTLSPYQNTQYVTGSCSDICDCCSISPNCEYCACSENGGDSGYIDIEFMPERGSRLQGSNIQRNSDSILRYPIIIKNGSRTRKLTSREGNMLSSGVLYDSRERFSETDASNPRQLLNNPHCYEVTVNVEWI